MHLELKKCCRRDNDESGKAVDKRWQTFIAENLPFYGCIFEHTFNRFNRIDLSILKNALMLHRVCRVLLLNIFLHYLINVSSVVDAREPEIVDK
jgi:Mitochondrial-associated sphingomyelin phosphodiesterase